MRKGRIFFYILILAGAFLLFFNIFGRQPDLTYSELTDLFAEGKVRSFVISDNVVTVTLKESKDNKDKLTVVYGDRNVVEGNGTVGFVCHTDILKFNHFNLP